MKRHLLKNNTGFTLVEVIISIAVLSLISGVVLKLFVLSSDVSEKVRIEDVASVYASNALEICKGATSPKDILNNEFFAKASLNDSQTEVVLYFDEKWGKVIKQASAYQLILKLSADEGTHLSRDLTNASMATTIKTSLYDLLVSVEQLDENGIYHSIVTYETSKYFAFEE